MKVQGVWIEWIDSMHTAGWADRDLCESKKLSNCKTLGWLIKETKDIFIIGLSFDNQTDSFGQLLTIPKVAVKKVRKLKEWSE